ncbi:MAG TPA: CPXCG motif-containing cysteine-rich protein [Nitrospiria bacterium]|jgi:hypothetical protein
MDDDFLDESDHSLETGNSYFCAYCGEPNEVIIDDPTAHHYKVVEDCSVCCRPNVVHFQQENGNWDTWATPENE